MYHVFLLLQNVYFLMETQQNIHPEKRMIEIDTPMSIYHNLNNDKTYT